MLPTVLEYLKNNQHLQMRVPYLYKGKSNSATQDTQHGYIILKDSRFHRKVKKDLTRLPSLEFGMPFDTMCKSCPLYEAGTLLGRTRYKKCENKMLTDTTEFSSLHWCLRFVAIFSLLTSGLDSSKSYFAAI